MTDEQPFDDYARRYDETVQQAIGASGESVHFFAELKVTLMARSLGSLQPASILDFGCGIGNTTRALTSAFPRAETTGYDVSAESIAIAQGIATSSGARTRFVTGTGATLPFPDGSFDAAFTSCVFHHIDEGERLAWAREIKRVLRPGAPFFLFEHNPYNPLTQRVVRNVPFDEGVVLLKPRTTVRLLEAAGFHTMSPHFYFFFPAMLRALRPLERLLRSVPLGAQYFVQGR